MLRVAVLIVRLRRLVRIRLLLLDVTRLRIRGLRVAGRRVLLLLRIPRLRAVVTRRDAGGQQSAATATSEANRTVFVEGMRIMMIPASATGSPTNAGTGGELGVSIRNGRRRVRCGRVTTCKVCCRVNRRAGGDARQGRDAARRPPSGDADAARSSVLPSHFRDPAPSPYRAAAAVRATHREIECAASRHLIGLGRRRPISWPDSLPTVAPCRLQCLPCPRR